MFKPKNSISGFCLSLAGMLLIVSVVFWTSCAQKPAEPTEKAESTQTSTVNESTTSNTVTVGSADSGKKMIERGKYLVTIMACQDCHSPHDEYGDVVKGKEFTGHWKNAPVPKWNEEIQAKNTTFMAVGPDFTSFAGVSKAKNLTPDPETGIGNLTEEQFVDLFKHGTLMPPMPLQWMNQMKEEDLKAIYAYLRTLPPVNNGAVEEVITAK